MELKKPSPEQAYWGLRAMKTVALADRQLADSERHMLTSVQHILGTTYELDQLHPITPAELAAGLTDPQIRYQLVNGLIVMSLIDSEPSAQEVALIEQFALTLNVSVPEVKTLRNVLEKEVIQLRLDLARRFWVRDKLREVWNEEGLKGIFKVVGGMLGQYSNSSLAARYHMLEQNPVGSLGRAYWEYCRDNGFGLPGEKVGPPEFVVFHDLTHVLSGYGTDPEGEVQVACFSAGYRRKDPFLFVFFVMLQFHVGIRMTPITKARTGFFDVEKSLIAMQRGAAMNLDLTDGWDYWPAMGEQLEDLRKRFNILPIEAFTPAR